MAELPTEPQFFLKELDFSHLNYADPNKDAKALKKAEDLIREKLPLMGQLHALLKVTLKANDTHSATFFIDGRSEPAKLLTECADEPACSLITRPAYVIEFGAGLLEPRFGLFKDGFFDQMLLPQGDIKAALKFGDLLCPVVPKAPTHFSVEAFPRLPKPTTSVEQLKSDMSEFGYAMMQDALTPSQVAFMRKAVLDQATGERAAGVAKMDGGAGANAPNQRLWCLANKGDEFLDLLNHPLIDATVPWFLGENAVLNTYTANIARPGGAPMMLHTDQVGIQPPQRHLAFGFNILWFLEDFRASNGATRVFPGSHEGAVAPADIFSVEGTVPAEGPAGTALLIDSRIWHATGANSETEGERPAILMYFIRGWVRQQENNALSLRQDVWDKLSERHQQFMGLRTTGAFGGVEGKVRHGLFVKRVENPIGRLRLCDN